MSLCPISAVEEHLVTTLQAALAGTKLRVQDLPGDWDDDMLARLLTLAPCVLIAFGGGPAQRGARDAQIDSKWLAYVVTNHPSGEQARRRGNAQALGAYEVLSRLVVPTLHGHVVPNRGSLQLVSVDNLFTGTVERQGLSVYAAAFALPLTFDAPTDADLVGFATFAAQVDIEPHASAATRREWLVGDYSDGMPDSRDTVSLPVLPTP